ncbi:hypothetical protein ACRERI_05380 [Methanothermobacter thermautotrophicus]|uniref:hypothetical protein n=1 Tax=Methanothermobacter thermautotrophicus TaxID=145262 RepID=UPI003D7F268B
MRWFAFVLVAVLCFCFIGNAGAVTLKYNEVSDASKMIKNYTEQQGKIPQRIIINEKTLKADDYLYAASTTITNLNQNKKVEITFNNIQAPTKPAGTATGTLKKTGLPASSPER